MQAPHLRPCRGRLAPAELRNADEFLQRVLAHYPWFDEQNINYRREDGTPAGKGGF